MGINADATAIQMRMLNMGKGPAVHSLRCQSDKVKYQHLMKQTIENTENLNVKQIMVTELKVEGRQGNRYRYRTWRILWC